MIKKQVSGSARRARNILWNAAGRYDFEPPFLAYFPNGAPDHYFNMVVGLAVKWLDMDRLWAFFESYAGERRAEEFDEFLWLGLENCVFEKELPLTCSIESGITVRGSDSHLRQVVDILLDNAQKYSHPCAPVQLALRRSGRGSCLLQVTTQGETLSKEDLKNIFKRFYRIDKARTLCRSYGLGLPIAQSIVSAHKGRIWAESDGGTNTFFVQLPTA